MEGEIVDLGDPWILASWGPMRMRIAAWGGRGKESAKEGGKKAFEIFGELPPYLPLLRRKVREIGEEDGWPEVVRRMIEASRMVDDEDLTPLSAVAGTLSELVTEYLVREGVRRAIAENGGDISLHLAEGEEVNVGVRLRVGSPQVTHILRIQEGMGIKGVATSGLGGRSLTKGVAEAAVVLASQASLADAAATSVANATLISSPRVKRVRAEELDPYTDLRGELVTLRVGELTPGEREEALRRGLFRAEGLVERGLIFGAIISVQGEVRWTEGIRPLLQ